MSFWRQLVRGTAWAVLLVGLSALVFMLGGRALRARDVAIRRQAIAETLGVPIERVGATGNPKEFRLTEPDGEGWLCGLTVDDAGQIWHVAFHLPHPEDFSWEQMGLEGVTHAVKAEIARYFGEEADELSCEHFADKAAGGAGHRFVCRGGDSAWLYEASVVTDLGIRRVAKRTATTYEVEQSAREATTDGTSSTQPDPRHVVAHALAVKEDAVRIERTEHKDDRRDVAQGTVVLDGQEQRVKVTYEAHTGGLRRIFLAGQKGLRGRGHADTDGGGARPGEGVEGAALP